ncbi:MAG: LL-diaminopimelate aminotransferase [Spirochaetales bacterium]
MITINENYRKLQASYLFTTISRKVEAYQKAHPDKPLIRLGIGDVTLPLSPTIVAAFHKGVEELSKAETFRGYGPEQGYAFLREAIAAHDFQARGAQIGAHEIVVSDGSKCDTGNFQELLGDKLRIGIPDPVYPVYVDTNVMAGRTGAAVDGRYEGLFYLEGNRENGFVPPPPTYALDLVYLCFPNNPTGAVATRAQLQAWVDYAREHKALLLFDAAYAAFIRDPQIPISIFEIPGARECAVEFRSFSKTAGFTGTRCAYTVIPDTVLVWDSEGNGHKLLDIWNRRHSTKFNGVSYPVQVAAAAVYTAEGQKEVRQLTDSYMANARLIRERLLSWGLEVTGGENGPYVWVKVGTDSWESFDRLLDEAQVVVTPGSGFGTCGQGYIRISAFNHREKVEVALSRLESVLGKR